MPVPTNLPRSSHPPTPTPARAMHLRTSSNQSCYSTTITPAGNHKLNVVTRLAVEGKAKQGEDGASIKMYLKISLPLDSVTPGSTIPLFPEENVKILTSQVHPIDNNSVPYSFSSTISPLLHNAARALNLPARSSKTFYSAFQLSHSSTNASTFSSNQSSMHETHAEASPPIDDKYTGHILVSGYSISYVLPKVFPSHSSDTDIEDLSRAPSKTRRPSLGERSSAHFMAAIDLWVPYLSRPPRSPFLLSIPTPRCLHNHIKLRIFPPSNASNSFASLSSFEEDGVSWDLTSDPHVTRSAHKRPSRSDSYTHFADDESSDSSTAGFSDGCGIQGTFPSAERIRLRWAKPLKTIDIPGNGEGRRRVGVKEAKGEMVCRVRGKMSNPETSDGEGVVMSVEYKGTCKGVWFSGVATLLGMDVGLESKGSDVSWVGDYASHWEVSGGIGYTGFEVGSSASTQPASRTSSLESSSSPPRIQVSAVNERQGPGGLISRTVSTSSTSSLLRAPLPVQNVAEYSFEGSTATLASSSLPGTLSSISSLPISTPILSQSAQVQPPGVPITLHINMNEILPPTKNTITFTISGTILVTPRTTVGRLNGTSYHSAIDGASEDPEPVVLPRFTVLAADTESTSIAVHNDIEGSTATVEVYNPTGDIYRDAQARKTVLQKGGFTRCGEDGGRIALRSLSQKNGALVSYPKTPKGKAISRVPSQPPFARGTYSVSSKRQVPLIIPSISATVTVLTLNESISPCSYAVRFFLNASALRDFEWLEFGFAKTPNSSTPTPDIQFVAATVDEMPVIVKTNIVEQTEPLEAAIAFERLSGKHFVNWAKVNVSCLAGGTVMIDYVVKEKSEVGHPTHGQWKGKGRNKDSHFLDLLLPTFPVPVGRLEVIFDDIFGFDTRSLQSNLKHHRSSHRLLQYSLQEYFSPQLSVMIHQGSTSKVTSSHRLGWYFSLTWTFLLLSILGLVCLGLETRRLIRSVEYYSIDKGTEWNDVLTTVTVTTTVYGTTETPRPIEGGPTDSSVTHTSTTLTSLQEEITLTSPTESPSPLSRVDPLYANSFSETPSPSLSLIDAYGFTPFRDIINFPWSIPGLDVNALKDTLQRAAQTIERVWQMFRKVYHYPLDAP